VPPPAVHCAAAGMGSKSDVAPVFVAIQCTKWSVIVFVLGGATIHCMSWHSPNLAAERAGITLHIHSGHDMRPSRRRDGVS
jgi:hypothetical protein